MKSISSAENSHFKRWLRLSESPRELRTQRLTLAEGPHLADAIHASGHPVAAVLVRRKAQRAEVLQWIETFTAANVPAYELAAALFDRLAPVERSSGLLLLIPLAEKAPPPPPGDALFLDGVQDPGNAGALLRVAAAAGVRSVLAAPGTVALWSPKVLRGAQGAHFRLHLSEDVPSGSVRTLRPMPWVGAAAHEGEPLWSLSFAGDPVGLMVGSEGGGLSPEALAGCDRRVTIPLASGVESLNVASAAAIFLFERRRQMQVLRAQRLLSA